MRITVLGKSPAWQDAGGACSGYLVEAGGRCLLLDCGNGVFAKLRAARAFTDVCAVVISHLHADHFIDLVPYAYALAYSHQARAAGSRPLLYAPPGARETFRRITGAWQAEELIEQAFELHEYDPATSSRSTRCACASTRSRTSSARTPCRCATAAAASPTAPTAGPTTRSSRSRATPTC